MRSDVHQIPQAPGTAAVGRTRTTPGGPTARAAAAGVATPAPAAPGPATTPAPRARTRPWSPAGAPTRRAPGLAAIAVPFLLLACANEANGQVGKLPEGPIAEVRFEGNATIPPEKIKAKLLSKAGQPFDPQKIDSDVKTLMQTNWFSQVEAWFDESPPKSGKYALIFSVREMPILTHVEFKGRKKVRLKEIEDTTGLKVGARADYMRTRNAMHSIYRLYKEKGYDLAEVELIEGGNPGDTKVVMQIFEGDKVNVASIDFVGNQFATGAMLKTHIQTRTPLIFGFFGRYQDGMLDEDQHKLLEYYQGLGFFEAKVTPVTRSGDRPGEIKLTFVIHEGPRYSVRKVIIEGNSKLKTPELMSDMELHSNKPYLLTMREADKNRILIKYNEIGCIDTEVSVEPRFTGQQGIVDLLYKINEGEPYLVGELVIHGNDRTRDKVIRREAVQAGLLPGEVFDKNRMEIFKRRLAMLGYFSNDPDKQEKQIRVEIQHRRPPDQPYGELMIQHLDQASRARMQDPQVTQARMQEPADGPTVGVQVPDPLTAQPRGPGAGAASAAPPALQPLGENPFSPPADSPPQVTIPPIDVPEPPPGPAPGPMAPGGLIAPGIPNGPPPGQPPVGAGEPPGSFPSIPGMGMTNVGPDRNDPFPNRSYADVITSIEEAPTGRFMVSVGANSFQGLMGGIMIYEKNFDLFNPPRSWADIVNSKAFRGGGQELRINLQAGTLINMMQVSIRDPYLFDLPIGGGASGYLFQRLYPNWDERRGGGRLSIGRQLGTMTYVDFAAWAEEVDFFGYKTPAPADYLAASGYTQLYAIMPSLRLDNRNNPFMPTKGQYANFSVEQGFGTFTFTKFDAEGRMYIPTFKRPDGTGQQFFTLRGHFGVATESTPVYERFFAGNFGSLRGFQYRSVSPHAFDVPTGGVMMAVGSVEYQIPWNARDTINQIFFTDFGTVTGNYELNDMRISVGTGLKLSLPMMGPMPFEFDLAFPVLHAVGDKMQWFNFTVSGMY
jgi:outer membrane protein insertion porin family